MSIMVNACVSPRVITINGDNVTKISIQELVNIIREWEQEPAHMSFPRLLSTSGKDDLGGGVKVGITARLLNTKVKFEDRTEWTTCTIYGGNLTAVDEDGVSMNPVQSADYVNTIIAQSSSATINESDPQKIDEELVAQHGEGSWQVGIEWEGI